MLRIGLLGFTLENANKGCEALTYSFLYTMQRLFGKKLTVRYYFVIELYGKIKEYFPDINFEFYQTSRKNILLDLKKDFTKNCDIVFDITYGDGFSDIYNPKSAYWNNLIKLRAGSSKTPYVLLPQTYGPFEDKKIERQAAKAIKKAVLVYSRDKLSTDYVKKISNVNAHTVTDLAFALPYTPKAFEKNKTHVGINVSGLLWKGGFYKENQFGLTVDYRKYIISLIEYFIDKPDCEVHLIPHVIESVDKSNDGDLFANDLLKNKYPSVIKAPAFSDPVECKNYIAGMDVLTAARMHATVDAFSAGVPVIPFAYSRKFEGLYGSIGYDYIVDGCKLSTNEALEKTIAMIDNREKLKNNLKKSLNIIVEKNEVFYSEIKNLQGEINVPKGKL